VLLFYHFAAKNASVLENFYTFALFVFAIFLDFSTKVCYNGYNQSKGS